jgi:hypothetical protein
MSGEWKVQSKRRSLATLALMWTKVSSQRLLRAFGTNEVK